MWASTSLASATTLLQRAASPMTTGVALLTDAGAQRIKFCYEPDNPAARGLYLSVGFEPVRQTVVYSRRPSTGSG